jgi:hypothetical protein
MRICGIELTAKEANICLLELADGLFEIPNCRVKKLSLLKDDEQESVRYFKFEFIKLMQDYHIDQLVIRSRMQKGKFSGSAVSFKIEGILQSCDEFSVELLHSSTIKEILKTSSIHLDFSETGLKKFQQPAFDAALAFAQKDN